MFNFGKLFSRQLMLLGLAASIASSGFSVPAPLIQAGASAKPANLPQGAKVFRDPATRKTYVAIPGKGTRDQQFAIAAKLSPGKSYAFVPSTVQEFEAVRRGLDFPTLDLYCVGIYRLAGAPKKEPRSYWTTVTGEPVLINESIWNPNAPNNGCVKKPKPVFSGGKLGLDWGPHCKNEYSCGIYNALGGALRGRLEDLGLGQVYNGVIVEVNP